ncbi:hypothetical protein JKF63_00941 [Porcisia hertigi]|uniref:Uncharacterized protein n=1 Tax=Porcisia hertigi TaxID=2761500 RepID=A0A836KXM6_9TRYP|nr:hypothetical protein JKF63_00941 [Porcisia hertigi]
MVYHITSRKLGPGRKKHRAELRSASLAYPPLTPARQPLRGKSCGRSPDTPGVLSSVYNPLVGLRNTQRVAPDAPRNITRGQSMGASAGGLHEVTHSSTAYSIKMPHTRQNQPHTENLPRKSLPSFTPPSPRAQPSQVHRECHVLNSSERRSAFHRSVGAIRVRVAALTAEITPDYMDDCAFYNYPLEVLRFLHEDGTQLSIMAENCSTFDSDAPLTTETYVKRSLVRARALAEATGTIFEVKLFTAARNIATTVMESYVCTHVGPSPVTLDTFYLVQDNMAYVIQMQTCTDTYEERLSSLLYAVQSARLHGADRTGGIWPPRRRGRNKYHVQVEGVDRIYVVETPVDVVVRAPTAPHAARSELSLTPSSRGCDPRASWKATVTVSPNTVSERKTDKEREHNVISLLCDAHVSVELTWHMAGSASADPTLSTPSLPPALVAVTAHEATAKDGDFLNSVYRSAHLTVPLPPPEHFDTVVCEHPYGSSLTLFITPVNAAELFEVELQSVSDMNDHSLGQLWSYVESLLLTPIHPQRSTNTAGQACFYVEGTAASTTKTKLWVGGAQLSKERWLLVRWLCADSAVVPRELEEYRSELLQRIVC